MENTPEKSQSKSKELNLQELLKTESKNHQFLPKRAQGNKREKNYKLKAALFIISGIISIYPKFLMVGESDTMEQLYPNKNYSFYVFIPTYISIPPAMILVKILAKVRFSMAAKLYSSVILSVLIFNFVPLIAIYFNDGYNVNNANNGDNSLYSGVKENRGNGSYSESDTTPKSYFWMLFSFSLMHVFCLMYQSYFNAILSIYDSKWTGLYYTFQAVGNLIVMLEKSIAFALDFSPKNDLFLTFGTYSFFCFLTLALYYKLSHTEDYRTQFSRKLVLTEQMKVDYTTAWKEIKSDGYGIFWTMFLTFLIFPGVLFSSMPPSLFSQKEYILYMNIIASIFDVTARPFAIKKFAKAIVKFSLYIMLVIAIYSLYSYFTDLYAEVEGTIYLNFVFMAFLFMRASISVSFFFINSNRKANEVTKEAIGSIMTNALHVGIAAGNLSSNLVLLIKEYYFE